MTDSVGEGALVIDAPLQGGRILLSTEQLRAILGQDVEEASLEGIDNRRAAPRATLGRRAQVAAGGVENRRWSRVMLHDISVKGVGFLSNGPMRIGTLFVMQLKDAAGDSLYLNCTVRRCEAGGMGGVSHVIGATFESFADADTLPGESETEGGVRGRRSWVADALSIVRQLSPLRLFHHGIKRFDDYSSIDDTKWFRRSP